MSGPGAEVSSKSKKKNKKKKGGVGAKEESTNGGIVASNGNVSEEEVEAVIAEKVEEKIVETLEVLGTVCSLHGAMESSMLAPYCAV